MAASAPTMAELYRDTVKNELMKEFGYRSTMEVPRIDKIVLSMGVGEAIENKKAIENAQNELSMIAGQRAVRTRAKKSIANFKVREGMEIGAKVTLRRAKMWEFLDRLVNIALPRVKDFRGINPNGFDGHGNYSLGVNEHIIFPEIDYDKIDKITGLNIVIVTTAQTDQEARSLLSKMKLPFRK